MTSLSFSEEHRKKISENNGMHRPEVRAKQYEIISRPEIRAKYLEAISRPEVISKRLQKVREALSRPEVRAKISGENHYRWKGGIFFNYCPRFKLARPEIRRQWGNVCIICGASPNGRELHVHHIHGDKGAGCYGQPLESECIPLCISHHAMAGHYSEWWVAYFENRLFNAFGWHIDLVKEE